ncbi:hypothetical protein ACE3MQ_03045 [Paenibacillus lentus]|uniref:hypothetical protein n=1 Tax=Paenibacillus lentus TaxID=1338368 RepID=UPI0036517416
MSPLRAFFLALVNSGTVNIALPSIMNDLQTNVNSIQWIVTGFMLAIGSIARKTNA